MATVKNTVDIQNDLIASVYENTSEDISGQALQDRLTDMAVSYINRITDKQYLGVREFSTSRDYDFEEGVIYLGAVWQCTNALGHTGAWNAANFQTISSSINPTDTFLPYNNAGVWADSWLYLSGDNVKIVDGKLFTSENEITQLEFGSGTVIQGKYTDGTVLSRFYADVNSATLDLDDGAGNAGSHYVTAGGSYVYHTDLISFDAPVYNFTQLTANYLPFIDGSSNMVSSVLSQAGSNLIIDDGSTMISVNGHSSFGFNSGTLYSLGYSSGSVSTEISGQDGGAVFNYMDGSNGGAITINTSSNTISHTDSIVFDSPIYNFNQLTATTVPYLNASKNLISSSITPTELGYLTGATSSLQAQIDALVSGLSWKQAARVRTTANITLVGAQTIDGVSVVAGDRVLVMDQTLPSENGIYLCASGAWTRTTDANTGDKILQATIATEEGTLYSDKQYVCTTNAPIVLGVSSIAFILVGGTTYVGTTNRITVTGNVIDISATYDAYVDGKVIDSIADSDTTHAPSRNAVFDALALKQGLDSDLTDIAALSPSNDDFMQRKSGAWTNRTVAQVKSDLNVGYWLTVPGTPVRVGNTSFTITDTANANLYDMLFGRTTVLKWTDTGVTKMAMVVSATYAANDVTITIIGDTLTSGATMSTFTYSKEKCKPVRFTIAGTIATGTNLSITEQPACSMKVFGADAIHATAGTTNATTYDINKNGTTMFSTKISIASAATAGNGFTADSGTETTFGDVITLDCDSVSTTAPVDVFVYLFLFPVKNQYLN